MGEVTTGRSPAPSLPTFAERVANVEKYLAEEVNDEIDQIPSDMDFHALLACIREQQAALQVVLMTDIYGGKVVEAQRAARAVLTKDEVKP
jgi:hypothetical protein